MDYEVIHEISLSKFEFLMGVRELKPFFRAVFYLLLFVYGMYEQYEYKSSNLQYSIFLLRVYLNACQYMIYGYISIFEIFKIRS